MLTKIEEMIMKCIWDTPEELSLSTLVEIVNERFHKDWRPQTISTYLAHLVKRGHLSMRRSGRYFLYKPTLSKKEYYNNRLNAIIEYWKDLATPLSMFQILASIDESDLDSKAINALLTYND